MDIPHHVYENESSLAIPWTCVTSNADTNPSAFEDYTTVTARLTSAAKCPACTITERKEAQMIRLKKSKGCCNGCFTF